MDSSEAQQLVHERFLVNWYQTPLCFDNDGYDPVADTAWPELPVNEWIRVTVLEGSATNAFLGGAIPDGPGAVLHSGNINIQIFVRLNTGSTRAKKLAADVAKLIQNTPFDGIRCYETSVIISGDDGAGWYQINAITVFEFYERKTS